MHQPTYSTPTRPAAAVFKPSYRRKQLVSCDEVFDDVRHGQEYLDHGTPAQVHAKVQAWAAAKDNPSSAPLHRLPATTPLIATKSYLDAGRVDDLRAAQAGRVPPPLLGRFDGEFYILDGHHRLAAELADGGPHIRAHVVDFDALAGGRPDRTRARRSFAEPPPSAGDFRAAGEGFFGGPAEVYAEADHERRRLLSLRHGQGGSGQPSGPPPGGTEAFAEFVSFCGGKGSRKPGPCPWAFWRRGGADGGEKPAAETPEPAGTGKAEAAGRGDSGPAAYGQAHAVPLEQPPTPQYQGHLAELDDPNGKAGFAWGVMAGRLGTTPGELQKRTAEAMQGLVNNSHLYMRVKTDKLRLILEAGRFKNQFETHNSDALLDYKGRARVEAETMNVPTSADGPHRPVYGYLAAKDFGDVPDQRTSNYGSVIFKFKESVRARSTVTFGDSFMHEATLAASPLDQVSHHSYPAASIPGLDPLGVVGSHKAAYAAVSYVEAQYHGGLSLDDVEEMRLPADVQISPQTAALLKQKGIKWQTYQRS